VQLICRGILLPHSDSLV